MESMLQVLTVKVENLTSAKASKDQEVDKYNLASGDPLSSPAFRDTLGTLDKCGGDNDSYSESVASEDIDCSVESDASSNAVNADSLLSDADSAAPSCEEKNLQRCPSGGSIVTYDEATSEVREGGESGEAGDMKLVPYSKQSRQGGLNEEQETSVNTGNRMAESVGPAWTDDKHCSYLNSIEATFVQSLYGQDYRTVDVSGQDDQDCVESRPMYANYGGYPPHCELFTSLQRGCYDQREYYRPNFLSTFAPSNNTVFRSPWVQHFNPRMSTPSNGGGGSFHEVSTAFVEGGLSSTFVNEGVKEEVMESFTEVPETRQAPQSWSTRLQSQLYASTSGPTRADTGAQIKKRSCNLDCNDVIQWPKKYKSTQRSLAEIDLEMEEQFVLKERILKEQIDHVDFKEAKVQFREASGELHSNHEQEHEDIKPSLESRSLLPQASSGWFTSSKEPIKSRTGLERVLTDTVTRQPTLFQDESSAVEKVESAGHCESVGPATSCHDGVDIKCHPDVGFHREEENEVLPKRSPRAFRPCTWGSIGTWRRMHNERSNVVEAATLSGSIKCSREDEAK